MDETMTHHIGFISTRFAGTDGVSLETQKWATVLERLGYQCFYFAGECDRNSDQSQVVPEAFYRHPEIDRINQQAYSGSWTVTREARAAHPEIEKLHKDFFSIYVRPPQMTRRVNELKEYLKEQLYEFAHRFDLEILVIENAVTIPLNLPLGLALTEFIAETGSLPSHIIMIFIGNASAFKSIVLEIISRRLSRQPCHPFDMSSSIRSKPSRSLRVMV